MKTKKTKLALNKITVSRLNNIEMSHVQGGDCIPPLPENTYTFYKELCTIWYTVECITDYAPISW